MESILKVRHWEIGGDIIEGNQMIRGLGQLFSEERLMRFALSNKKAQGET